MWDDPKVFSRFVAARLGETPLHEAAMKGYVALAEQLLAARACIDAKDDQGPSPPWTNLDLAFSSI